MGPRPRHPSPIDHGPPSRRPQRRATERAQPPQLQGAQRPKRGRRARDLAHSEHGGKLDPLDAPAHPFRVGARQRSCFAVRPDAVLACSRSLTAVDFAASSTARGGSVLPSRGGSIPTSARDRVVCGWLSVAEDNPSN